MIRIVRIISRLNVGGPAQHAIYLTQAMQDENWRTVLVSGVEDEHENDMLSLAAARGVSVTRLSSMKRSLNPLNDWRALVALVRLLKQERPQIVHTHTAKAGALGRVAAWWTGVPVVVHTFHGHVLSGYFHPLKTWLFARLERWLGRGSTFLITLTERLKAELLERHISGRRGIRVVPLGLELKRFGAMQRDPAFRAELGLAAGVPLIGIVGRLVPIKRHEDLLVALHHLKGQGRVVHLAIVGGGEREDFLRREIERLELREQVSLCGFRQDLERIYGALDAVVLCSGNEGMPVALIEAMACGLPIVSTDVGGVADLLSNYPSYRLVPVGNFELLAAAIAETLKHTEDLREKAQSVRNETLRRYSVENLVSALKAVYREALEQRP